MKKKPHVPTTREETVEAQNPALAELLQAKGFAPSSAPEPAPPAPPPNRQDAALAKQGKLVLRREKKGRKGKTVTIVSGLTLPSRDLEELARTLRKALGCGSTIESGTLVLLGDITDRAARWLREHGAKTVIIGN
ncbi:MAG: translation initiation factor [Armatimonadota bacterium]